MDPNGLVKTDPTEDAPVSGRVVMTSVFTAKRGAKDELSREKTVLF